MCRCAVERAGLMEENRLLDEKSAHLQADVMQLLEDRQGHVPNVEEQAVASAEEYWQSQVRFEPNCLILLSW